jgi:serine/threonine protein kinase
MSIGGNGRTVTAPTWSAKGEVDTLASVHCLSPDDCFDYLEGRADGLDIEAWRHHLDACDACRILVAEAARSAVISTSSGSEIAPRTLADDEVIGNRYRILRFVARGGMGEVYEAFDSVLQERLALKTLVLTAIDKEEAVARLLDEVRIARKVAHPNVCRIWEVGIHRWRSPREGAVPFLTMDFLTGETLAQRLSRVGRLPEATAASIFRALCAGLAAVHEAGIVHRDLKSDNVFLATDGDTDRVVVMDFGLARALEQSHSHFASSGRQLLGTAAYMAPEQVEGGKVTQAADIFALGIVMFEVLTGQVPFSGATAASVALSRLRHEAPKPSTLVPELGPAWDALVSRCLARDPRARPADADAVRIALDQLALTPNHRREPPAWRKIAAIAPLAAGFAALINGAASVNKQPTLPPPLSSPATPTANPSAAAFPVSTLSSAQYGGAAPTSSSDLPRKKESGPGAPGKSPRAAKPRPTHPTVDSAALIDAAEDLLTRGKIAQACEAAERAAQNAASAAAQAFLGRCYMRLGNPQRARQSYAKYLELAPNAANAEFVRAIVRDGEP